MAKRDFEKELGEYISARNKGKPFSLKEFISGLIPKKDEVVDVPENIELYSDEEIIKIEEKPKEPWFKKIFSSDSKKDKENQDKSLDIEYKVMAEDAIHDLKSVTKIALEAIKELPSDKVKGFRESESFAMMKKILKKHELIK